MADEDHFVDLVCEGGGVKGIGLAGAFAAIEQRGYVPKRVAGTSAGAITAALVAAGFTSSELDKIVLDLPFAKFKDERWEKHLPLIGDELDILRHRGIYKGAFFHDWMAQQLALKDITRFGQLADTECDDLAERYRLRVIASDVTHRR